MPPVRWKVFTTVAIASLIYQIGQAEKLHDLMPITSDGWRPILGTSNKNVQEEITLYKNPTHTDQNSKPVKAQPVHLQTQLPTVSTKPYQTISTSRSTASFPPNNNINVAAKQHVLKIPHTKTPYQFLLLSNHQNQHTHGPHIPLTASGNKNVPRHPGINKLQPINGKRPVKPVRGQVIAHSMKNEVYVPAPSAAIGTFAFYNQGPIKPQGFGGKPFHPQFSSPFGLPGIPGLQSPNDMILQQVPIQTFVIQNRNPNQNPFINHNDEYTRNLVPPPFKIQYQQEREKPKPFKQSEQSPVNDQATNINNPQLIIGKTKEAPNFRPGVPENVLVQLPPRYEQSNQFTPSFNQQKPKEPEEVEVQVTKENLEVFHNNIPPNFNPDEIQYKQQYNFQNIPRPDEEQKYSFETIQTTKNPKQVFRKPITERYPVFEDNKREIFKKPISESPIYPTYDVTEGTRNRWEGFQSFRPSPPSYQSRRPQSPERIPPQQSDFVFLPTPYTSDSSVPTSQTQSEVSAIYSELNHRKRPSNADYSAIDPNYYNLKEVSTHYPIVGPPEAPQLFPAPNESQNSAFSSEITTTKEEHRPKIYEQDPTIQPIRTPVREYQEENQRPQRRRRPIQQRTRPTTTTTTTTTVETVPAIDSYEVSKIHSDEESYSMETPRPQRRRKPTRARTTTEIVPIETTKPRDITRPTIISRQRYRNRYEENRLRPTTSAESIEEMPLNHKMTEAVSYSGGIVRQHGRDSFVRSEATNQFRTQETTAENVPTVKHETEFLKTRNRIEIDESGTENNYPEVVSYGKNYHSTESDETGEISDLKATQETVTDRSRSEEYATQPRRRFRYPTSTTSTTTERQLVDGVLTPENEIESDYHYSTQTNNFEPTRESVTVLEANAITNSANEEIEKELYTIATTPATTTTTTTTEIPTIITTKANRTRGRPVKYDSKIRPRFSVKEYRQRLSQYSTTTTETPRITTESPSRLRFPNRSRKPIFNYITEEETTTERIKFVPKDPRHGIATTNGVATNSVTTESAITEKKVNTRVRSFGRYRSSTEATTTTPKVSIKSNIFSNLRRPPPISLKTKIMSKYNPTNEQEKVTEKPVEVLTTESTEPSETTISYNIPLDSATEIEVSKVTESETLKNAEFEDDEADEDSTKNESYLQSQRVADLTLASQKDYETPGVFKSLSTNTRIVPSYFTISTDDPILPIEAFFPNIIDKNLKNN